MRTGAAFHSLVVYTARNAADLLKLVEQYQHRLQTLVEQYQHRLQNLCRKKGLEAVHTCNFRFGFPFRWM